MLTGQIRHRPDRRSRITGPHLRLRPVDHGVQVLMPPGPAGPLRPLPAHAGKGLSPPQADRPTQQQRPLFRRAARLAGQPDQPPEPVQVHRFDVHLEDVSARAVGQHRCARRPRVGQHAADAGDVRVQRPARAGRRLLAPHAADQRLRRHQPAGIGQQPRQHSAPLWRSGGRASPLGPYLDRTQHPKVHRACPSHVSAPMADGNPANTTPEKHHSTPPRGATDGHAAECTTQASSGTATAADNDPGKVAPHCPGIGHRGFDAARRAGPPPCQSAGGRPVSAGRVPAPGPRTGPGAPRGPSPR